MTTKMSDLSYALADYFQPESQPPPRPGAIQVRCAYINDGDESLVGYDDLDALVAEVASVRARPNAGGAIEGSLAARFSWVPDHDDTLGVMEFTCRTLDASAYAWDFGDDSEIDDSDGQVTHAYTYGGTYKVSLTVTIDAVVSTAWGYVHVPHGPGDGGSGSGS